MRRTGIDDGIPVAELLVGDLVAGLNGVALVTSNNLVVLVTVLSDAGLVGGVAIVSGLRDGGSGLGAWDVNADEVVQPKVRALCT